MDKNAEIYMNIDGTELGPFGFDQLVENGLKPDALVWWQGAATWAEASEVPELQPLLEQAVKLEQEKSSPQLELDASKPATIRCPYCSEEILATARKCRYCNEWLNPGAPASPRPVAVPQPVPQPKRSGRIIVIASIAAAVLAIVAGVLIYALNQPTRSHINEEADDEAISHVEGKPSDDTGSSSATKESEETDGLNRVLPDGYYRYEGTWNDELYDPQPCIVEFTKQGGRITGVYTNCKYNYSNSMVGNLEGSMLRLTGVCNNKRLEINLPLYDGLDYIDGFGEHGDHYATTPLHRTN